MPITTWTVPELSHDLAFLAATGLRRRPGWSSMTFHPTFTHFLHIFGRCSRHRPIDSLCPVLIPLLVSPCIIIHLYQYLHHLLRSESELIRQASSTTIFTSTQTATSDG